MGRRSLEHRSVLPFLSPPNVKTRRKRVVRDESTNLNSGRLLKRKLDAKLWKQAMNFQEQAIGQAAFGDEAVNAVRKTFLFERWAADLGIDDDAKGGLSGAKLNGGFEAVHTRHAEIEKGEIDLIVSAQLNGVDAIAGGADDVEPTGKFEVVANGTESGGGVVGDEDADCGRIGHRE